MLFLNGKCYKGKLVSPTGEGKVAYWRVFKNGILEVKCVKEADFFSLRLEMLILRTSVALRALKCPWMVTVFRKCGREKA